LIIEEKKDINGKEKNCMIKKFLKIRNINRFVKWLDQTNVHAEIRDTYFTMPWVMWPNERKSIERRLESTHQRDVFCLNRAKIRPGWNKAITRLGQFEKAQKLLQYVKKRYARVLKRKMIKKNEHKNYEKSVR
jgi:hypothetical protein